MIRKHENPVAIRAGALSIVVHGALLLMLVLSVNFKSSPPVSYSEVELWDTLPSQAPKNKPIAVKVLPKIEEQIIEPKVEPIPEPVIEKPVVKQTTKPDIQIKEEIKKPKVETPKSEKTKPEILEIVKPKKDALKDLQAMMAAEDNKAQANTSKKTEKALNQARISAVNQGEIDKYRALIAEKIKDKVNKDLCNAGNKKVTLKISMMATGEVSNTHVTSSSGSEACDQAIESAVLLAQPLPLPADKELFSQFRDLTLNFRPTE